MKFKSNIEVQAGLEDASGSPGTVNQLLSSTVTGTAWIDPSTIVAEAASLVIIACKNTSGAAIPKGTPVYQTGNVGATATIEIAPADALISANKLPAIGVLQTDLNNNGFGNVVITGELTNFTTSPIDGVVPTTGDKIFVKSGGGLTLTKPTGEGNGIQNMGLVGKVSSGNSGSITVSSIMRTNDVPNLPEGRIWIGDGNTIVSDTVYVDEPNNRVGIGTTSPNSKLDIIQTTDGSGVRIYGYDDRSTEYLRISDNGSSGVYGATDNVKLESGGTGYVFLDSNNDIFFDVGSSGFNFRFRDGAGNELMRIEGGGNVGIGTTSPGEKLEVAGNIELNSGALIISGTPAGQGAQTRYISGAATTNDLWLNVPTNGRYRFAVADSQKVEITADGNVGIGTTNPSNPLHVYSSDNILATFESTDAISEIRIKDSSKYTRLLTVGSDFKIMPNDGVEIAVFEGDTGRTLFNAGNVGIGTTGPDKKLEVSGDIKISGGDYNGLFFENASGTTKTLLYQHAGYDALVIKDIVNNADRVTFKNNGNVGIGTTSPSEKLDVAGNISTDGTLNTQSTVTVGNGQIVLGGTGRIQGVDTVTAATDAANKAYVDAHGGGLGPFLPLAGGTMTGNTSHSDNVKDRYGTGNDFQIWHDGSNTFLSNEGEGHLNIINTGDDRDIIFKTDDGTGATTSYMVVDGSAEQTRFYKDTRHADGIVANFGNSDDLKIYHDGSNSYIKDNGIGDLRFMASNIKFYDNATAELMTQMIPNGAVELYYNNSKKFETTNTGVDVTGSVQIDSALLSNQENTDIDSAAAEVVAQVSITDYTAAFFDFVVKKGTNVRSGTVYACHDGTNVEFTETSTNDLGDTSDVTLSVDKTSTNLRLIATVTSDDWSVKSLIRAI
jgi:hypothetical protein